MPPEGRIPEVTISALRIIGVALGWLTLLHVFFRLRRRVSQQKGIWVQLFVGVSLVLVSLFPRMATLFSDFLSLGGIPGGRIISLLLVSNLLLWALAISHHIRGERTRDQLDRFVREFVQREFAQDPAVTMQAPGAVVVILPALNEAENLAAVLPRIPEAIGDTSVRAVVVNDGSTDNTGEVARDRGALVVDLPVNRGGGAALRTGYDAARRLQAAIVVTMDADGQHQPEEIAALIEPIRDGEADIVIGSRILGSCDDYSRLRYAGVKLFSRIINVLMGIRITDCSSGFRAFRVSILDKLSLKQDQYHTAELIIDAAKRGYRIAERPIHIRARLTGTSKKGTNLLYAFRFILSILFSWWR